MASNPATGGIKVKTYICLRGTAITSELMRINTLNFTHTHEQARCSQPYT